MGTCQGVVGRVVAERGREKGELEGKEFWNVGEGGVLLEV